MTNNSSNIRIQTNEQLKTILAEMKPPFNPFKIAEKIGIEVKQNIDWDKIAYDGEIYLNSNMQPEIWINPTNSINRQTFTLAHEIGHLFNDVLPNIELFKDPIRDDYTTLRRDGSKNSSELKANIFASNLLMPQDVILEIATNILKDFKRDNGKNAKMKIENFIEIMSNKFEVSQSAMKWRLINIGLIDKEY